MNLTGHCWHHVRAGAPQLIPAVTRPRDRALGGAMVRWHPLARRELFEASAFYDAETEGIGRL